jgi:hypothetical protein
MLTQQAVLLVNGKIKQIQINIDMSSKKGMTSYIRIYGTLMRKLSTKLIKVFGNWGNGQLQTIKLGLRILVI